MNVKRLRPPKALQPTTRRRLVSPLPGLIQSNSTINIHNNTTTNSRFQKPDSAETRPDHRLRRN